MTFDRPEVREAALQYIQKYGTEEGICKNNSLIPLKQDRAYWDYKNATDDNGHFLNPEFRAKVDEAFSLAQNRLQVISESGIVIEHENPLEAIQDEIKRGEYNRLTRKSWKETQVINGEEREVTITEEERRRSPRLPLLLNALDNALPTEKSFVMFIADVNQFFLQCGLFDDHDTDRILSAIEHYYKQRLKTLRLHRNA